MFTQFNLEPVMNIEKFTFTPELLAELKRGYRNALATKQETFVFHGNEVLVAYARYLIEYLENRFDEGSTGQR